jgi:hypothetical protein
MAENTAEKVDLDRDLLVDRVTSLEKSLRELGGILSQKGDELDSHELRLDRLERETGLLRG